MKNIHVLPTDKLSRLFKVSGELKLTRNFDFYNGSEYQNIYITSDEEIKEGDCFLHPDNTVERASRNLDGRGVKKIILTTDASLDDVQAIDDEFLEWFVKNPSCEEIELKKGFADGTAYGYNFLDYKIIIPKE